MSSVKEVSKAILQLSSKPVSNLKLQKLLYYVQGWKLGLYGSTAFYEQIEAWAHGPVVPAAFYEYRHFGWNPITVPAGSYDLSTDDVAHIRSVLEIYGDFTATQLEQFSHEETPWIIARGALEPGAICRTEITQASMQTYFAERANA